jgi:hypothetical protein
MSRYLSLVIVVVLLGFAAGATTGLAQEATGPVANPGGPYQGFTGQLIEMTGAESTGVNLTFVWTFGDGTTGIGPVVKKAYGRGGTYTVTLTVTDGNGQSATATTTATIRPVTVTNIPVTCVVPIAGHPCFFFVGPVFIPACAPVGAIITGCVVLPR